MSHAGGQWNDLGPRLISGGVFAAVSVSIMWWGGIPFHLLIVLISGVILWELVRMIGGEQAAVPVAVAGALSLFAAMELDSGYALLFLMLPSMVGTAFLPDNRVTYAIYTAAILVAGFGLTILRDDFGFGWMGWLALVVIVTDVMGYFAGRLIGGPKIWPKVSPKKTWSGAIAGWVGAALVAVFFVWQGASGLELIAISVAVSIASQMGDVAQSALKRRMGVKDSSALMPGHGGMFDRFDGMLGASVFLLLVEQIVDFPPAQVPL